MDNVYNVLTREKDFCLVVCGLDDFCLTQCIDSRRVCLQCSDFICFTDFFRDIGVIHDTYDIVLPH